MWRAVSFSWVMSWKLQTKWLISSSSSLTPLTMSRTGKRCPSLCRHCSSPSQYPCRLTAAITSSLRVSP